MRWPREARSPAERPPRSSRIGWRTALFVVAAAAGCTDLLGINTDRPLVPPAADGSAGSGQDGFAPADDGSHDAGNGSDATTPDAGIDAAPEAAGFQLACPGDAGTTCDSGPTTPFTLTAPFHGTPNFPDHAACGVPFVIDVAGNNQVEAENYDIGGQGISYYDTTPCNQFGNYRSDDVDILIGACGSGCTAVESIAKGEWTRYSVDVKTAGAYAIWLGASASQTAALQIEIDGTAVSAGGLTVPVTDPVPFDGGRGTFKSLATGVDACFAV